MLSDPFHREKKVMEAQKGLGWKGPEGSPHSNPVAQAGQLPPDLVAPSPIQPSLGHLEPNPVTALVKLTWLTFTQLVLLGRSFAHTRVDVFTLSTKKGGTHLCPRALSQALILTLGW